MTEGGRSSLCAYAAGIDASTAALCFGSGRRTRGDGFGGGNGGSDAAGRATSTRNSEDGGSEPLELEAEAAAGGSVPSSYAVSGIHYQEHRV